MFNTQWLKRFTKFNFNYNFVTTSLQLRCNFVIDLVQLCSGFVSTSFQLRFKFVYNFDIISL